MPPTDCLLAQKSKCQIHFGGFDRLPRSNVGRGLRRPLNLFHSNCKFRVGTDDLQKASRLYVDTKKDAGKQHVKGIRSILGQNGNMPGQNGHMPGASETAEADRTTAIGAGVTPLFPGFNDLYYSDTATCESRFQNGYFDESDKDPLAYMTLRNQVQLSTYANCVGKDLKDLYRFISDHLRGAVGSVHLLPIYPSSGDGGFAPIDYTRVDPEVGSWDDVKTLSDRFDLCLEFMVNHISPESDQFKDFIQKGDESEFANMFIDWDKFWPEGRPTKEDLARIRTRKGEAPVLEVEMVDGSKRRVWCTFGPQQIDINPMSPAGWQFVHKSICSLYHKGARVIRLDAFGYFTKKLGTRCFFEEPESWELLEKIEKLVEERGIRLLCEVHEEYETNLKIAKRGYWVYDFALPLLVLHAFHFKTAQNLRHWLQICPRRQITVLDTHDGMGIDDIQGLATVCDTEQLKKIASEAQSKNLASITPKFLYDPEKSVYVSNPHQINCTYYSACEHEDHLYLLARAIQFFCPGIPLVYYVGMLAGSNDLCLAKKTGSGREINRHRYSYEQAVEEVQRPVVQTLLELCRFRNQHSAFRGRMHVDDDAPGHVLVVTWQNGEARATLNVDFQTKAFSIAHTRQDHKEGDELRVVRFERGGEGPHEDSILGLDATVRMAPERGEKFVSV